MANKLSGLVNNSMANKLSGLVLFMVLNATCNNISVLSWSVLLVEETGVHG